MMIIDKDKFCSPYKIPNIENHRIRQRNALFRPITEHRWSAITVYNIQ